jgi:Emfourin
MIHSASFFELPAKSQKSHSGADRFQYKVMVVIDARRHTIEIEESAVPPLLRPLLNWLTGKAKGR